jgi:hypothetical protein
MPVDFDLAQNFPNPFNDQTQICFLLPQAVRARVSILNLLGREIAILVDDHLQSGRHQINFSAQAFASGIYYYRLQTEDYSATKKMVLLR